MTPPPVMTPAGFAHLVSSGQWQLPRHLDLLNRKLGRVAIGSIKRLLITMPPRHGKSEFTSKYFPAWYLGTFPDRRVILASYESDFAMTWGRKVRDLLQEHGPVIFGVGVRKDSTAANRWGIEGHPGGMDTAGVGGAVTGKGAHLLIIDDPVKNAEEAASETMRNKAWEWFTSTAYTRMEPGGAIIVIQTRWHEDDLAGRLLARGEAELGETWDVVDLPAMAREGDILGRAPGEALWPERFTADDLANIRQNIGEYFFSALYDQTPTPPGGGMLKSIWFQPVDARPAHAQWVRYWDKAGTQDGGAFTAGVLMGRANDGIFYVADVVRGQWSAGEREQRIRQTAEHDGKSVSVWVEQEPGSGGKESAQNTVLNLAGWHVQAESVTGDKVTRARPLASQAEVGNLRIVRDSPEKRWNQKFLDECDGFPHGKYKDQVDAASGAFNKLALIPRPGASAVAGHRPTLTNVNAGLRQVTMMRGGR